MTGNKFSLSVTPFDSVYNCGLGCDKYVLEYSATYKNGKVNIDEPQKKLKPEPQKRIAMNVLVRSAKRKNKEAMQAYMDFLQGKLSVKDEDGEHTPKSLD